LDVPCPDCHALHWAAEKLSTSTRSKAKFGICCNSGKVRLLPLQPLPPQLRELLTAQHAQAKEFWENIWKYNQSFTFTSINAKEDRSVNHGRGEPVFRILGELFHCGGLLRPENGRRPTYAQLYIYDPQTALDTRQSLNATLNSDTIRVIQQTLLAYNPYAAVFRHAHEVLQDRDRDGISDVSVRLRAASLGIGEHKRRGNLPTADEVAVIICDSNRENPSNPQDIVLYLRDGGLQIINDLNPAYAPLYYVLLFPCGELGWHPDLTMHEPGREKPRRLSQTCFVAYRLQVRPQEFLTILHGKHLLQCYLVDMYASIDQNRLCYLKLNQKKLHAAVYSGLQDALTAADEEVDLNQLGKRTILPSSYIGGPRHMQQRYQDSMAIARHFRHCDLFLTMTCNP
ncbi:hypothetical protein FA15DRAFT_552145, partial [Coprinopsis marcescibilis]